MQSFKEFAQKYELNLVRDKNRSKLSFKKKAFNYYWRLSIIKKRLSKLSSASIWMKFFSLEWQWAVYFQLSDNEDRDSFIHPCRYNMCLRYGSYTPYSHEKLFMRAHYNNNKIATVIYNHRQTCLLCAAIQQFCRYFVSLIFFNKLFCVYNLVFLNITLTDQTYG